MKKYALYECPIDEKLTTENKIEMVNYKIDEAEFIGYFNNFEEMEYDDVATFLYENKKFDEISKGSFIAEFDTDNSKILAEKLNGSKNLLLLDKNEFSDKDILKTYISPNTRKMEDLFFYWKEHIGDDEKICFNTKNATLFRKTVDDYFDMEACDYFLKKIKPIAQEQVENDIREQVKIGGIDEVLDFQYSSVAYNRSFELLKEMRNELDYFLDKGYFDTYKGVEVDNIKGFSVVRIMDDITWKMKNEDFLEEINDKIKGNYDSSINNDFFEVEWEKEKKTSAKLHDIRQFEEIEISKKIEEKEKNKNVYVSKEFDWNE